MRQPLTSNGFPGVRESQHNSMQLSSYSTGTLKFRRFSPSRRMFCLLTLFDFLFTLIAWIIYSHAFKDGLRKSFQKEVAHYKIKASLFDLVLLSLWRLVVLLLAYALFVSRKWYTIAVVTTVSTAFVIAKVFLYDFEKDSEGHPMDYVIVTMSLVLCWVETWVLDFKVIPSECEAEERSVAESLETTAGERRPLLRDQYSAGLYNTRSWLSEQASFYTPHGSTPGSQIGSDDESTYDDLRISIQDREFQRQSKETFEEALKLLTMDEKDWKFEKTKDDITVSSCNSKNGKLFKVQCTVDAKPKHVFSQIVLHVETGPQWNDSVAESRVLHKIDNHTDICYNVTTETAGGMVASRDFVNLRHWQQRGNAYISCNASVEYDGMPPAKQHIRGINHAGGWFFAEQEGHRNRTDFIMIVSTDLKGWLPQYLIDQAMTGVLYGTADSLRKYIYANKTPEITISDVEAR